MPTTTTTTLQAVCGDGIIEYPPEQCDGESFCEPTYCSIDRYACCQFGTDPSACSERVTLYTYFAEQYSACGQHGGTYVIGDVPSGTAPCATGPGTQGPCVPAPSLPAPVTVCCEPTAGSCRETTTSESSEVSVFYWNCAYASGQEPLTAFVVGTCGNDGRCVPAQTTSTTTTLPCGLAFGPCCAGGTCNQPDTVCFGGQCAFCGSPGYPCCTGGVCHGAAQCVGTACQ